MESCLDSVRFLFCFLKAMSLSIISAIIIILGGYVIFRHFGHSLLMLKTADSFGFNTSS